MKLDRNINGGVGKYALVKRRRIQEFEDQSKSGVAAQARTAIAFLEKIGVIDSGDTPETEFFVVRLRDIYADRALAAYANAAYPDDPEYADEVFDLASRAGKANPHAKAPD